MIFRTTKQRFDLRRAIAAAAAILVIAGQFAGVFHYHGAADFGFAENSAQLRAAEGLCPLCEIASHSVGSISAAPAISRGPDISEPARLAESPAVRAAVFSPERGRAPPVSQPA